MSGAYIKGTKSQSNKSGVATGVALDAGDLKCLLITRYLQEDRRVDDDCFSNRAQGQQTSLFADQDDDEEL